MANNVSQTLRDVTTKVWEMEQEIVAFKDKIGKLEAQNAKLRDALDTANTIIPEVRFAAPPALPEGRF